nr:MAG TPA: hypothetical protein [Bacteriophage sp.]
MKLMITDTNGNKMYYGGRRKDGSYKITSSASDALPLALELKATSIRCGAIFKGSILTINLSMWIELGFSGEMT